MTFECTKSKCDEDESTIPNNPITYVLGEKVDGFTVVDIDMNTGVATLRNLQMTFENSGLPKNFKWRD
ncbi:hypothetical protein ACMV5I_26965 [Serratia sp. T13T92]|uniref:hypothetical protein n=1 Tax=Serratia TaxID=613 RepID=UPI00137862B6|nr:MULTISPECIES: hypothetical protein [Serratia]NBJ34742.1 hypothetical protein [Serratia fonticola]UAN58881.1 hypothetical protein KGP21_07475 [Serratia sp. JSRIV004]